VGALPDNTPPEVSVIVPAYDAQGTLARTLESLRAQTHPHWEAVVVDDGSADATGEVAAAFARRDARIRAVSQAHAGVGAARNRAIGMARFDWLLCLDADDWLDPSALERLTAPLAADDAPDAVYGGWARVGGGGEVLLTHHWERPSELFPAFARVCALPTLACVVRRPLVRGVGAYDASLVTCEDWDLWQRIARTGARFEAIPELVAFYRLSARSASLDPWQVLADGLRVIERGHSPDPRVPVPHPAHAAGAPAGELSGARLSFACWPAGLLLGEGREATQVLQELEAGSVAGLDPHEAAELLFAAVSLTADGRPADWLTLWPFVDHRLDRFLAALEERAAQEGLARSVRTALERFARERTGRPAATW
jgi:hypothetical protein